MEGGVAPGMPAPCADRQDGLRNCMEKISLQFQSFYFDHVVLQNGKEIVLSRNSRGELKNQYQQFLFHLARKGAI